MVDVQQFTSFSSNTLNLRLGSEQDLIAMKHEVDEEDGALLRSSRRSEDIDGQLPKVDNARLRNRTTAYMRILLELTMAGTIAFLLFLRPSPLACEVSKIRRSPVPQFPKKIYTFTNDPHYAREDMFFSENTTLHTLHNWIPLSSASRGYVVLPLSTSSSSEYNLPNPYTVQLDRHSEGPGYMMSVFHQLHCLSYLAAHFQQGYGGVKLEEEIAHHSAHCFNYLRQGIMCSADTTLEGKTNAGPGEGSEHECNDYDAVLEWANEHKAMAWREELLPDISIL